MSKICLYLTFAIVLCLFATTSLADSKPDAGIDVIINKAGAMPKAPRAPRLKKLMKGIMLTNIYTIIRAHIKHIPYSHT